MIVHTCKMPIASYVCCTHEIPDQRMTSLHLEIHLSVVCVHQTGTNINRYQL